MQTDFEQELIGAPEQLEAAREQLLAVAGGLLDADLARARRGGWAVARVLEHVIQSEWLYAGLVAHLRDRPSPGDVATGMPTSVADAVDRLAASHRALLAALDGVDEASFYRLRAVGHEEYSILSVLENGTNHDREHAGQVQAILAHGQWDSRNG